MDGDTFMVKKKILGSQYVRLANVNTPEKGKRGWERAMHILRGMIGGREVVIIPVSNDRYGRVVAEVIRRGTNINKRMRALGY